MTPSSDLQIVCLLDVLGFENLLKTIGLEGIHTKYSRLIDYVKQQKGGIDVVPTPDGHVAMGWLVIGNAYFSDSVLFWTRYSKMALSDAERGVFLGAPLIEAGRTERTQQWVGVSFGPSFALPEFNSGFYLHTLLPYKSHYKGPANEYVTGMAVDWPRRWRESRATDALPLLKSLDRDPVFSDYYSRTETFISLSEKHHDWFRKQGRLDYG